MMQPSLSLNLGQQLQITPKLQQAIRMLQLSTQELTQELLNLLETNIMLDIDTQLNEIDILPSPSTDEEVDDYPQDYNDTNANTAGDLDCPIHDKQHQTDYNLQEYLLWQLRSSQFSQSQYIIGEAIIFAINDDGFLQETLVEIQEDLAHLNHHFDLQQIEQALKKIKRFDPLGVGAKDLQEALLLQLNALAKTPIRDLAQNMVEHHLSLLAAHDYHRLMITYKIKKPCLNQAIILIQQLNPRPGSTLLLKGESTYISPDLIAFKKDHTWRVKLNSLLLPKLRLNQTYLPLLEKNPQSSECHFIHHHLREAKWLIQCVKQRNETLVKVAGCIIRRQQAFMDHGPAAMQALILKDVANELCLHQSTISRVSTKKYIQTPQGTFELKYFFTSHIDTDYGRRCSALAIQTFIKKMIQQENPLKPASDNNLARQLALKGLPVARRTVSKYRELMHIPAAAKRKRINNQ